MSNNATEEKTQSIITNDESSNQKRLLTDESFTLLRNAQLKIVDTTDVMPSLRKLVNELVTTEHVDMLTSRLINELG